MGKTLTYIIKYVYRFSWCKKKIKRLICLCEMTLLPDMSKIDQSVKWLVQKIDWLIYELLNICIYQSRNTEALIMKKNQGYYRYESLDMKQLLDKSILIEISKEYF